MPLLLENDFLSVSVDHDQRILRSVRSSRTYDATFHSRQFEDELRQVFAGIDRPRYGHLLDIRAVGLNNDAAFEASTTRLRDVFMGEFARVAVLVRTAVGALQMGRLIREELRDPEGTRRIENFNDEAAALRFLAGAPLTRAPSSAPRPPPSAKSR